MKIALIQLNAGPDKKKNLDGALRFVLEAVRRKAEFILLPELFNYRGPAHPQNGYAHVAESIPGDSTLPLMLFARAHHVFILAGSVYEKIKGSKKVFNTSVLINDKGKIIAKYRKNNLFKARVDGETIDESRFLSAGSSLAVAKIRDFKVGLSICYDLRFPEIYQKYARRGADIMCVPSSFTKTTGQAHWEVLLRARAIENRCYVLAPNQCGKSGRGVMTFGHSVIIDSWGRILAEASGEKEKVTYSIINIQNLRRVRKILPLR